MKAVRGFHKDMTATLGKGIFQYEPGKTYREEECKARTTGFHFTEYPPDCLEYYGLGKGNRYFLVDVKDINDNDDKVSACKEMTLEKELNMQQFAALTMMYMVNNPRMDWERKLHMCTIKKDEARANEEGAIAIARGADPVVEGVKGAILGLMREAEGILAARVFTAKEAGRYRISEDSEVVPL